MYVRHWQLAASCLTKKYLEISFSLWYHFLYMGGPLVQHELATNVRH